MTNYKTGSFLIELLIVFAISTIIMAGLAVFISGNSDSMVKTVRRQTAGRLVKQSLERVKAIWSEDWGLLDDGVWHLELGGGSWLLLPGVESDGVYQKQIEILPVYRDTDGNMSDSSALLDPSSKRIISTVTWSDSKPYTVREELVLSNYLNQDIWIEDTLADFSDGTEDATDFSINPGFVELAQTGGGGWSEPSSLRTIDGDHKASGICSSGDYLYLTQDRAFGRVEAFDINTDPSTPASRGVFAVSFMPNDCTISGDYLYLADNMFIFPSISIYNIGSNPVSPPYVGSINIIFAAGSVAANDDYLYISYKDSRYILAFSVAGGHQTNPQYLGYFSTNQDVQDMSLSGNYLYIAQQDSTSAFRIYDISANPASPQLVNTFSLFYEPTGIDVDSNILYFSLFHKRGAMFLLDNPVSPQLLGYFPTERNTADVASYGDYGYIAGADSQLKVIEVFDLSDSKGISGIYFVYGEYLSSVFSTGSPISTYRLSWEGETPVGTQIMFQTAINSDNMTWDFVGPDGTGASYFIEPGAISFPSSLGSYISYKAILVGDGSLTPSLDKVTISYAK